MEKVLKCHLFKDTPSKFDLVPTRDRFILIKTLVYESHIFRYILECRKCKQLYFFEFYEEIDWVAGNDPQYNTYIPVKTVEEAEELDKKSQIQLMGVVPRLQSDFFQDGTEAIRWVR